MGGPEERQYRSASVRKFTRHGHDEEVRRVSRKVLKKSGDLPRRVFSIESGGLGFADDASETGPPAIGSVDIRTEGADERWYWVAGAAGKVSDDPVMRAHPVNAGRKITDESSVSIALGHPSRCRVLEHTPQSLRQPIEFVNDRLRLRGVLVTQVLQFRVGHLVDATRKGFGELRNGRITKGLGR